MRVNTLHRRGQATVETLMLLPLFLLLAFGLIQVGQMTVATMVADYAASAIARQLVQDQNQGSSGIIDSGDYMTRYQSLLAVGMKQPALRVEYTHESAAFLDVTVHACAQINAFPFLGEFLKPVVGVTYAGSGSGCGEGIGLGPFYFNGVVPYHFTVHGKAMARMNYQPLL